MQTAAFERQLNFLIAIPHLAQRSALILTEKFNAESAIKNALCDTSIQLNFTRTVGNVANCRHQNYLACSGNRFLPSMTARLPKFGPFAWHAIVS